MSFLTVLLALGATFGNGLILVVIARFKSFRTVPNTLLANLAVVDMLNAVINTPIYTMSFILEAGWFRGQGLSIDHVQLLQPIIYHTQPCIHAGFDGKHVLCH